MQICTIKPPAPKPEVNEIQKSFFEYYADLAEKHGNVCIIKIEEMDFIVKALGRRDYREVMLNQDLNNYLKEEAICEICCLYPEEFNFEDCDAGIASKLYEEIIRFSYLENQQEQDRIGLMSYFRNEMVELHSQMNCMIAEAFPSLNFDDIENFDMMTALRYLSRAEWILQNLRGFEMHNDPFTGKEWEPDQIPQPEQPAPIPEPVRPVKQERREPKVKPPGANTDNSFIPGETIEERIERLKKGEIQPKKLTREKLNELEAQFPEVNWRAQLDKQDFQGEVDTTPMALRTPDQIHNK